MGLKAVIVLAGSGGASLGGRTITGGGTLLSTDAFVYVNNTTAGPISLTLPPSPASNQFLVITDVAGNAATYHITVTGTVSGVTNPIIGANYASIGLSYTGSAWVQVF